MSFGFVPARLIASVIDKLGSKFSGRQKKENHRIFFQFTINQLNLCIILI